MLFNRPIIFITISYVFIILISVYIKALTPGDNIHFKAKKRIEAIGLVCDEPQVNGNMQSFLLKLRLIKTKSKYYPSEIVVKTYYSSTGKKIAYGDILKIKGIIGRAKQNTNPYEFDYQDYLERKGIAAIFKAANEHDIKILQKGKGNIIVHFSLKIKNRIAEIYREIIPGKYSVLLGSMIFGVKAFPIPDDMKERYQKTGVLHILVASGQQVSLLIAVCIAVSKLIKPAPFAVFLATTILIWVFTLMAGCGSSIVRAAIMGQIMIFGSFLDRQNDFYNSLAISALVLLIINPFNLFDIGFQLSYLATWALVYLCPIFETLFSNYMPKWASNPLAIALAPICVTTPLSIYYFSSFTYIAVLANIMVVPMAEIITIFGFIFTFLGFINMFFAELFGKIIYLFIIALDNIVFFLSQIPGMYTHIKSPDFIFILLYFAGLIFVADKIKKGEFFCFLYKRCRYIVYGLVVILIWNSCSSLFAQKEFVATFLDVGQGDSIFLEMPNGENCLIDGGKKNNVLVPFLNKKGVNQIDMVILTHPHEDHVGGLVGVLENFKIREVLDSGCDAASASYQRFLALIEKNKIKYTKGRAGQSLNFGSVSGHVLSPFDQLINGTMSDLNNNSIVTRFIYGDTRILFAADAGFEEESGMLASGAPIQSDVLKVGHHGSATSTSDEFLDNVSPKSAIISVGAFNKYKHPHFAALKRLHDRAVKVYRTDKNGAIVVRSDGNHIYINPAIY